MRILSRRDSSALQVTELTSSAHSFSEGSGIRDLAGKSSHVRWF